MGHLSRCPDARALLPAYVESELSPAEQGRVSGHLQICSACRAEEAQYRAALGLLSAPIEPMPHRDLYAGFAAKLERYERKSFFRQRQLRWAGSLACLLLVVGASASWIAVSRSNHPLQPASGPVDVAVVKPQPGPMDTVRIARGGSAATTAGNKGQDASAISEPDVVLPDPTNPQRLANDAGVPVAEVSADELRSKQPERRQVKPIRRPHTELASNFLDVRPEHGDAARDQLRAKATRDTGAASGEVVGIAVPHKGAPKLVVAENPSVPGLAYYEKQAEQRLQVGETVTRMSGARGYNSQGDLVFVKVNIGTTSKTEPDTDTSSKTTLSGEEK